MSTKEELQKRVTELEAELEKVRVFHQSEQKQVKATSKYLYRRLVEKHPYGIHENDTSGIITFANAAYCQIFDFDHPEQVVGEPIWSTMETEQEQEQLRQYLAYLVHETPPPVSYESKSYTKDGRSIDLKVDWDYKRDEQGQVTGFISVTTDVTERKRVEEAIRENEERLDLAMEAANAGVWEFWPQDDRAFFNDHWFMMLDYEPDELVHSYAMWRSLLHPDDVDPTEAIVFAAVGSGDDFATEFRMKTKSGGWCWIHDIGKTIERTEDGATRRMLGIHIDITERKQAEQAIKESEARLRGLYESSLIGIILNDYETGDYMEANDGFLEMVGYTLDELNDLSYWDLTPKKYDEDEQAQVRSMEETERYGPYEKEYIHKDGTVFPVLLNGVVVTDQAGHRLIWSTVEDITERKQAEAEHEHLQQEIIKAQKQALKELATPIIPVMERILVMPLIGSIDSMRARDITRALLAGIREHQAQVVILDITGVSIVDSGVANHLNKTIQAARLKGARAIITGISDAVAETIVDLGIDWSGINTLNDLQTGLVVALNMIGRRIVDR